MVANGVGMSIEGLGGVSLGLMGAVSGPTGHPGGGTRRSERTALTVGRVLAEGPPMQSGQRGAWVFEAASCKLRC